ncbi:MAG: lytic transglycosylase domain-containing protein [Desulfobacterales bacterium]|nr:lytic transglycosylase domain-containing protein [Desulfobacterales bacterium]
MRFVVAVFLLASLLLFTRDSSAGIYRYVDENGVIHFTNCPRDPKFKLYFRESSEDPSLNLRTASYGSIRDTNAYDHLISEYAQRYQVDFALIKSIIRAESGFNPDAISRKGARGLMQLMPETALRMNVSNVHNPRENIAGGVRYFRHLLSLFNNNLQLSLAAYNAGENLVSELGTIPPYRETADYVQKVMSFYQYYRQ